MRYEITLLKNKLSFWITEKEIEEWKNNTNIFFILAQGRSGTKFLVNLLNKDENAKVCHEPVPNEGKAHQQAYWSQLKAERYINNFRVKDMYLRCRNEDIYVYGEVNSFLRRHCNTLKNVFPNAKFFHLIRDGRDVVRSMMSRSTMKPGDKNTHFIYPKNGSKYKDKWEEMDRFEKICWYWMIENEYLLKNINKIITFEKIISDYQYFKMDVLDKIELEISKDIWNKEITNPKNVTKEYEIPHWTEWSKERETKFWNIAGEVMKHVGYKKHR